VFGWTIQREFASAAPVTAPNINKVAIGQPPRPLGTLTGADMMLSARYATRGANFSIIASVAATFSLTAMKLSGLTEMESMPQRTRNSANSG
jgi:hypothetical protein